MSREYVQLLDHPAPPTSFPCHHFCITTLMWVQTQLT